MTSPHHDANAPGTTVSGPRDDAPTHQGDAEHRHPRSSPRRTVIKGAIWSVPVITAAANAPAYAASNTVPFGIMFDGGGGANGYLNSAYLDLGISRKVARTTYTLINALVVVVDVIGLSGPAANERSFTAGSSYGTLSRAAYNASTRTTRLTWTLPAGTMIPKLSTANSVPDILFSFRDGATGNGRVTNKIVVQSVRNGYINDPAAPPLDSTVVRDQNQGAPSPDGIY